MRRNIRTIFKKFSKHIHTHIHVSILFLNLLRTKCPDGCRKGIQKEVSGHLSPHIIINIFICKYMTRGESGDTHNTTEHESQNNRHHTKFTKSSTARFLPIRRNWGSHSLNANLLDSTRVFKDKNLEGTIGVAQLMCKHLKFPPPVIFGLRVGGTKILEGTKLNCYPPLPPSY